MMKKQGEIKENIDKERKKNEQLQKVIAGQAKQYVDFGATGFNQGGGGDTPTKTGSSSNNLMLLPPPKPL